MEFVGINPKHIEIKHRHSQISRISEFQEKNGCLFLEKILYFLALCPSSFGAHSTTYLLVLILSISASVGNGRFSLCGSESEKDIFWLDKARKENLASFEGWLVMVVLIRGYWFFRESKV
ncbi:hypothetical protein SCA6_007503 [Theobroma cacao]